MAEMPLPASDAHLRLILDVPKHWLLHFVGLSPLSAHSLRKAFIEAHRQSSSGYVLQHTVASFGDVLTNAEQTARMSGDAGIPCEQRAAQTGVFARRGLPYFAHGIAPCRGSRKELQ